MNERTMCGTTRPTNAIGPHAAVAAPASSVIATTPSTRVRRTEWPSERATSSPRDSALSAGALASPITAPTSRNHCTWPATPGSRPAIEPTAQNRYASSVWTSMRITAEVSAASSADTAAPASASVTGVGPPRPTDPSTNTSTLAPSAPANANQT
ncbi:hypothetical protein BJF78_22270 [Pseudonocardia sp. CNS-139]|nr:hypothetical protein BJF78_22270 [Pseudonocardia sp. CNS-139]